MQLPYTVRKRFLLDDNMGETTIYFEVGARNYLNLSRKKPVQKLQKHSTSPYYTYVILVDWSTPSK
jgi:hypothetical protein